LTDFQTGLLISAVGLLVTFSALGIFIGVMVLLQKLFPVKEEKAETTVEETKPVEITTEVESGVEEIAAAVAAVSYLRSQRAGQLGATLLSGPGPYRTSR
jgi:Na+-transporting methylmalonyl-CoA/oxaloacetate decarboxylase gamma subunit